MVPTLQYTANPAESLSDSCQQSYNSSVLSALRTLGATFKQICISQPTIIAVTYNEGSLQFTYNTTAQQVGLDSFKTGFLNVKFKFEKKKKVQLMCMPKTVLCILHHNQFHSFGLVWSLLYKLCKEKNVCKFWCFLGGWVLWFFFFF